MTAPVIDWIVAEWLATRIAGPSLDSPGIGIDLEPLARDAERRVVAYTGLTPARPLPAPEAVSRGEWASSNIASSRAMIDPLLERVAHKLTGPKGVSLLASAAVSIEIGVMLGYMSSRVLGQYELILLDDTRQPAEREDREPRLLMVIPNLARAIDRFGADPDQFMTWVTLHEVTHAVQFGSVPWLRGHLGGLIEELAARAEERIGSRRSVLRLPGRGELERMARTARSGDLIRIFGGERERELIDSAQAVMAVIEGHAEHVMDAVAPELIPSLPQLRAKMTQRRKQQRPMARAISRALGMEMKMRQYEQGKAFCDAVVAAAGTDALRHLFSAPEALPSLVEIQAPDAWIKRVRDEL